MARVSNAGFMGLLSIAVAWGCEANGPADAPSATDVELVGAASVGVLDGAPELVFGSVGDVRAMPDGSFFVLDIVGQAVRWFGVDGEYRGGITATGEGPGEFGRPVAMDLSPEGRLGILDLGNRRISFFRPTSGDLRYEDAIRVALSPYSYNDRNLCSLEDLWFLYRMDGGSVIRAYDRDGQLVRAFQRPDPPSDKNLGAIESIAEFVMNSGMLLCIGDRFRVISVGLRSDRVRAFSAKGEMLWEQPIPNLRPERYQVVEGRPPGFQNPSEGAHVAVSLVRWSDRSVLVQYRFWSGDRRNPDVSRIDSIELSLEDGHELSRTDQLPVIADVSGDLIYTYENEPFPQVFLMRRN